MGRRLRRQSIVTELLVPYERGDVLAMAHREGEVMDSVESDDGWQIVIRVDEGSAGRLADFQVDQSSPGFDVGG